MTADVLYGLVVVAAGIAAKLVYAQFPGLRDAADALFVLVVAALVVRLRRAIEDERRLARTDGLTGVPNRRTFVEVAEARIRRMARDPSPCTVVYIDIDRFKQINDRFGHAAGDAVLKAVARSLVRNVRGCDTVARLGGDEFAILLEGGEPLPVVTRLRVELRRLAREQSWDIGFSIGAMRFDTAPASAEEMLLRTDEAMYAAKRIGDELVYRLA